MFVLPIPDMLHAPVDGITVAIIAPSTLQSIMQRFISAVVLKPKAMPR